MVRRAFKFTAAPGDFLQGVPAHDISPDEFLSLTPEQRGILEDNLNGPSPLYQEISEQAFARLQEAAGRAGQRDAASEPPPASAEARRRSGRQSGAHPPTLSAQEGSV